MAQTFTKQLQERNTGEGIVTIHQDKAIEDLVNGPHVTVASAASKHADKKAGTNKSAKTNKKAGEKTTQPARQNTDITLKSDSLSADSTLNKPRKTYRTTGYRVQAFAGGNSRSDRQRAEQTGNQLRALFPEHQVYVHFYSPRWICRIGNFKSYSDANQLKSELKELGFKTATIVKGKITLQY